VRGKSKFRKIISIFITLAVLVSVTAAFTVTSYAAAPDIIDTTGDQWLYPGEDASISLSLSGPADSVSLMLWKNGSWTKFKSCIQADLDGKEWICEIKENQAPFASMELRFYIYYDGNMGVKYSNHFFIEWTSFKGESRIFGANRFETARKIADRSRVVSGGGPYDHVIIASGMDFADALGGTYLANELNAPILLVKDDPKVIQDTVKEIQTNMKSDGVVFILGGTAAVPLAMRDALMDAGITRIHPFAGSNRYETNLKIIEYTDYYAEPDKLIICSGKDFADALSASATGLPIMLVNDRLTLDQEAYFMENDPYIYIAGGPGAVSQAVEDELRNDFGMEVRRLYGANRYQTSKEIAYHFFPHQSYNAVVALGQDFPDGLAGGPLAYKLRAPLLLVDNNNYMPAYWFAFEHGVRKLYILGGPALISDKTADLIIDM